MLKNLNHETSGRCDWTCTTWVEALHSAALDYYVVSIIEMNGDHGYRHACMHGETRIEALKIRARASLSAYSGRSRDRD